MGFNWHCGCCALVDWPVEPMRPQWRFRTAHHGDRDPFSGQVSPPSGRLPMQGILQIESIDPADDPQASIPRIGVGPVVRAWIVAAQAAPPCRVMLTRVIVVDQLAQVHGSSQQLENLF